MGSECVTENTLLMSNSPPCTSGVQEKNPVMVELEVIEVKVEPVVHAEGINPVENASSRLEKQLPSDATIAENSSVASAELSYNAENVYSATSQNLPTCDNLSLFPVKEFLKSDLNTFLVADHDDKPFFCNICHKRLKSNRSLKYHIETVHRGEKPFECNYCSKHFSKKTYVSWHIKEMHTNDKPYACYYCGERFVLNSQLVKHVTVHTGEKQHSCKVCQKGFRSKSCLARHFRIHTGDKPYVCNFCNTSFADKSHLTVHLRIHTGDKPFKCSLCNNYFRHKSYLNAHIRSHTGERPYICSICNKGFTRKFDLTRHDKTRHGDMDPESGAYPENSNSLLCSCCGKFCQNKAALLSHVKTHDKPRTCNFCGRVFQTPSQLVVHVRTHTGERPFTCLVCKKSFSKNSHLTRHSKLHTKNLDALFSSIQQSHSIQDESKESDLHKCALPFPKVAQKNETLLCDTF